jgi:prepilin-type N-terminal cleavage/methylation domain-containing protein
VKSQRGVTLLEVMISMAVVLVGMLGLFRVLGSSIQGSAAARRFTQGQARMQQIHEAIRTVPKVVLDCLAGNPATQWDTCELLCKNTLGPTASPQACVFYTLATAKQDQDSGTQQYAVVVDPNDLTRTTRVTSTGVSGRVYDVMITVGWNDDGTADAAQPQHRVTARSALFK